MPLSARPMRSSSASLLGRALVLDEDRARAELFVSADRAGDVLHVAIAVIGVDQHRQQRGGGENVAHAGVHFAEAGKPDVGQRMPRADQRKAADRIGGETGALDQPRGQRIVRAGQKQRLGPGEEGFPGEVGHAAECSGRACDCREVMETESGALHVIASAAKQSSLPVGTGLLRRVRSLQ
jgi:hypothetical protein